MKNYYAIDVETMEEKEDGYYYPILDTNKFVLGAIMDKNKKVEYFEDKDKMFHKIGSIIYEHLIVKKQKVFFYAHNTEYDFYAIFKNYMKEMIRCKKLNLICVRPFIGILDNKAYILDTMSFFPMSLSKVGELIGLEKKEMPERIKSTEELKEYLYRDVEIIIEALKLLKTTMNELGFRPQKYITGPSLAMNSFISHLTKHKYGGWIISNGRIHKDENNIKFLRQASRGGYNYAFQKGRFKDCTLLDINSSYWKAMLEMMFPDLLKERRLSKEDIDFIGRERVLEKIGVSKCTMRCPEINVGVLGMRYKDNTHSMYQQHFPHNSEIITGTWTHIEINYALSRGYEMYEMHDSVIWEKELHFNPLREHIQKLYDFRIKHKENKPMKHFIKLLGNGLYGKFIQKSTHKEFLWIKREEVDKYLSEGWKVTSAEDDYCITREKEPYIPKYMSIILGVLITATARISLIKDMEKIPKEDLLYCDTDSIMFKGDYKDRFFIGEGIGEYKVEETGEALIRGEKKYSIGEKTALSGLFRSETRKEFLENLKPITVKRMIGYKRALQIGDFNKTGTFEETTMEMSNTSKKDVILPNEMIEVEM